MKILILGAGGMLGHKLVQTLNVKFDVWATVKGEFGNYEKYEIFDKERVIESIDVEDFENLALTIKKLKPQVIINAIGIIKQLPTSKNVVKTLSVNSILPHRLAELAAKINAKLINISTDCVFDGAKGNYSEIDISNATDVYGKSKNLGEVVEGNCLTIRTSIIGRELQTAHSLVEWFLSNRGGIAKGFVNAIYSGFPTIVLADIIGDIIENHFDLRGLYHISADPINKFELLQLINEAFDAKIEIEPFEDFRIDRSLNSAKFRNETGFKPESWRKMIEQMAQDPTPYDNWRK